jgi:hypothetical protein
MKGEKNMDKSKKDKLLTEINRLFMENELAVDDREEILESILMHHLDQMDDIEEIDLFQERINDMIDSYVEQHFEDTMEDNYN